MMVIFPLPTLPEFLKPFDINGDGRIDPFEAAEALKRWVIFWRERPEQLTCDLNFDKACDLIDFSILLYYVGR